MSPIFVYICPNKKCGYEQEEIRKIAEAADPAWCEKCGWQMEQTPAVPGKFVRGAGGWSSPE